MRVAYLVNQYPAVSHTFIRREIAALEEHGVKVERFAVNRPRDGVTDAADQVELLRTTYLLGNGVGSLIAALVRIAITRPLAMSRGLVLTLAMVGRTGGLIRHLAYLAEACRLAVLMRRRGVTHVHAHFGTNPATVARLARAVGGVTYSFTVHGPDEFDCPVALDLAGKARKAAFVCAISHYTRAQLFRWLDAGDWPKVRVVRCGLDRSFLDAHPTAVRENGHLLCVGRLAPQKGQLLLLEAVAELVRRGKSPRLVLAGDGPLRPLLESRLVSLGLLGTSRSPAGLMVPRFASGCCHARRWSAPASLKGCRSC